MSAQQDSTGKCLCGAVRFAVPLKAPEVAVCHCSMCRRWSGGPFMAVEAAAAARFEGEENVRVYRSSKWGERGFCDRCGTLLFWRMQETGPGTHYAVSAGALDDQSRLALTMQIFIDEKPAFYDLANDTPKLTGEQVFALFSEGENGS